MAVTISAPQLTLSHSLREIIKNHFPSIGELPITGGWGYDQDSAILINKDDPIVDQNIPFNGVSIEYLLVEKRIYEELIVTRGDDDKHSGIEWTQTLQKVIKRDNRVYDVLDYDVTAFKDRDWEQLKTEWIEHDSFEGDAEGLQKHNEKRDARKIQFSTTYWFDITSFFGQSSTESSVEGNALPERPKTLSHQDLIALIESEKDPFFLSTPEETITHMTEQSETKTRRSPIPSQKTPETLSDKQSRHATLTWIALSFISVLLMRKGLAEFYPWVLSTPTDLQVYMAIIAALKYALMLVCVIFTYFVIFPKIDYYSNYKSVLVIGSVYCAYNIFTLGDLSPKISEQIDILPIIAAYLASWGFAALILIIIAKRRPTAGSNG